MLGIRRDTAPDASVRLYGVVNLADSAAEGAVRRGPMARRGVLGAVEVMRVRGLGAVVAPAPFVPAPLTVEQLDEYRDVVTALFAERAVLPAPPGTVFRSHAAVVAWLELHAATLADALRFAEERVEARVMVTPRAPGAAAPSAEGAGDIVARAVDVLQTLRSDAVSFLVLRSDEAELPATPGDAAAPPPERPTAHAAFLVDRQRWRAFVDAVKRAEDARPDLALRVTGPWPPFDFVRLELGA